MGRKATKAATKETESLFAATLSRCLAVVHTRNGGEQTQMGRNEAATAWRRLVQNRRRGRVKRVTRLALPQSQGCHTVVKSAVDHSKDGGEQTRMGRNEATTAWRRLALKWGGVG